MLWNLNKGMAMPWGGGIANLGSPTRVTVSGEVVFSAFLRRNSVGENFDIRGIWLVKIHVDGFLGLGREGYAKVGVEVYVV